MRARAPSFREIDAPTKIMPASCPMVDGATLHLRFCLCLVGEVDRDARWCAPFDSGFARQETPR
jgi:hypothetical protein